MTAHDDLGRYESEWPYVACADAHRLRSMCAAVLLFAAVVLVAVVFAAALAVVSAAVDTGGRPAVASDFDATGAATVRTHVAQPGDTLWSIADRYRGDVGQGRFVEALFDANGGTVIQIGQAVHLP